MNAKDSKNMELSRLELLKSAKTELKKLQLFPDFKGNTQFRDAAIANIKFFRELSQDGYKKMVRIINKEELSQEDVDTYNEIINLINTKTNELANDYNNALNHLLRSNVPKPAIATQRI